jgi:hypothetical protein
LLPVLVSGIKGLFGFLSTVTLSLPPLFCAPVNTTGAGFDDTLEPFFDKGWIVSLACPFVWIVGAFFTEDDDVEDDDSIFLLPPLLLLWTTGTEFCPFFSLTVVWVGGVDVDDPIVVVDFVMVVFCAGIAGTFFTAGVIAAAVVRASSRTGRATASAFFIVSAPFPVVPFGSVIYTRPIGFYSMCFCRLLCRYCRDNHFPTTFDPMVEGAN